MTCRWMTSPPRAPASTRWPTPAKRAGHPDRLDHLRADLLVGMLTGRYTAMTDHQILAHLHATAPDTRDPDGEPGQDDPDDEDGPSDDGAGDEGRGLGDG